MRIPDDVYDALKFIAIYIIPSVETFWLTIGNAWQLPYVQEIGITIGALGILIAGCIGISNAAYTEEKRREHEGTADAGD